MGNGGGVKEQAFLGGRVRVRRLPSYEGAPEPGAPILKRLRLPQGRLAQFGDSEEGFRYMAWVELTASGPRGNHLHRRKEEWFYLIEGEVEIVAEDPATGERAVFTIRGGDLVVIETGIAHAYRPLGAGHAVEFSPARFDPSDSEAYPL